MCKLLIFIGILTLSFNQTLYSQNKAVALDSLFSSLFKNGEFNGNVLIAEYGKTIYQKSFGFSNEETKERLNENSIFELQSISKQFTAMAIAILKEQGKLNFDDNIANYFPELSIYKNVTIRNLLNHTNGLPDYGDDPFLSYFDKTKIATNKDVLDILIRYHPSIIFESNSEYKYSGTGYALLGIIIEKVSNETYADFLTNHIFNPLAMKNSFVYNRRKDPQEINYYAFGYVKDSLKKYVLPDVLPESQSVIYFDGIIGGRGVNATTADLLIWDRALKINKLVSQETMDEIYSPAILNSKEKSQYGLGWKLENSETCGQIVRHSGSNIGYSTYFERHVSNDKTIIILQNHDVSLVIMPIKEIRQIIYR